MKGSTGLQITSNKRLSRHKVVCIVLLAVASFYPFWPAYRCGEFLNDDSYITLTYAKNLAAGRGFVFNHGPPTLGTTTPLLALMVGGLGYVLPGMEVSRIAVLLTAWCWIGIAWVMFAFRKSLQLEVWEATVMGVFILVAGWPMMWGILGPSILGMEGYLFEFLLVLGIALFLRGWHLCSGLAVGLLFVARGEGALVAPLLIVWRVASEANAEKKDVRKASKAVLAISVGFWVPVLIWMVYAYYTFGAVFPNTLQAKIAQGLIGENPLFGVPLLGEWFRLWEIDYPLPKVLFSFVAAVGFVYAVLRKPTWLIFLAWLGVYFGAYYLLKVAGYWWYALPIYFVGIKFIGLGLIAMARIITTATDKLKGDFRLVGRIAAVGVVAVVILVKFQTFFLGTLKYQGDLRGVAYLGVSQWLRENSEPSESVAFGEIGFLSYHTDNRIVDLWGLTMPDVTPYVAKGDLASGFWNHNPDYYVWVPGDEHWDGINEHPDFARLYRHVASIKGHPPRELVWIYARVKDPPQ